MFKCCLNAKKVDHIFKSFDALQSFINYRKSKTIFRSSLNFYLLRHPVPSFMCIGTPCTQFQQFPTFHHITLGMFSYELMKSELPYTYKLEISVCLCVCPIITQEPLTELSQILNSRSMAMFLDWYSEILVFRRNWVLIQH